MIEHDVEAAANEFKALIEDYSRRLPGSKFIGLCSYVASIGLQAYFKASKAYVSHQVKGDLEQYGHRMADFHDHLESALSVAANLAIDGLTVKIDFTDAPPLPPTPGKPKLSLVKSETQNKSETPVDGGPKVS